MIKQKKLTRAVIIACIGLMPGLTFAAKSNKQLEAEVSQLKNDLAEMRNMMKEIRKNQVTKSDVAVMKKRVEKVAKTQLETENSASQAHLAGYAQFNYSAKDRTYVDDGNKATNYNEFSNTTFAPIFHYQYNDLLMFEAEMALSIDDEGNTDTELEYATADLMINDNMTLLVGKFLSPIGQFRQNIHPGWINKLATAPVGFGHDQAAPIANIGAQLRGGFYLSDTMFSYATYVGNGPKLSSGGHGGAGIGIEAVGTTDNDNDELTYGGRIAMMPISALEVGISAATGKAALTYTDVNAIQITEKNRDYDVFGADFVYTMKGFQGRGEYISQKLGSRSGSEIDSGSNKWSAWYLQGSYRFPATKWEIVTRYSEFDSPNSGDGDPDDPFVKNDLDQWSLGVNYLFANNIIGKISYDINDGNKDSLQDEDALTLQMTYGF
ncbi:hypothetical protein [sulfur-oxidizing endosymbiont of Gigantopelta aegis]|uniref:hypothetical protein n=1 Tax=sulfur-oxidizing endosymbiont of Gigantopelta aegis TaxID=2794934 RepID=UPI0018DC706D|nr:hypothetical protein [sulfur-oxidizing endosymbiont of Gigantopelta aegis]